MRLLLDEHHSPKIAAQLVTAGYDVVSASSDPQTRNIPDEQLLEAATADQRVVVTENIADFIPLASRWIRDGHRYPGILLTHPDKCNRSRSSYPGSLTRALKAFLHDPPVSGNSWLWWL